MNGNVNSHAYGNKTAKTGQQNPFKHTAHAAIVGRNWRRMWMCEDKGCRCCRKRRVTILKQTNNHIHTEESYTEREKKRKTVTGKDRTAIDRRAQMKREDIARDRPAHLDVSHTVVDRHYWHAPQLTQHTRHNGHTLQRGTHSGPFCVCNCRQV